MSATCDVCRGAIPDGETVDGHTALCAAVVSKEARRLRAALEEITRSHPSLVTRSGGPAPWLVAKAALLNMASDDVHAVIAEWAKTEPRVRRT